MLAGRLFQRAPLERLLRRFSSFCLEVWAAHLQFGLGIWNSEAESCLESWKLAAWAKGRPQNVQRAPIGRQTLNAGQNCKTGQIGGQTRLADARNSRDWPQAQMET